MSEHGSVGKIRAKADLIVEDPARRGNLDHTYVVKRLLLRNEVRITPDRQEFTGPNGIRPVRRYNIDGIANRWQLSVSTKCTVIGPRYVVHLLAQFTLGIHPSLDDLDAVQIGANRVAQRNDHEAR